MKTKGSHITHNGLQLALVPLQIKTNISVYDRTQQRKTKLKINNQAKGIDANCCYAMALNSKKMENKILENWKQIEEIEKQVQEKTNDPQAGFNASSFWLCGTGRHLMIPCMYRTKKGENFSKSYKEMMVYAKFCPFTGKPLYEDSVDSTI